MINRLGKYLNLLLLIVFQVVISTTYANIDQFLRKPAPLSLTGTYSSRSFRILINQNNQNNDKTSCSATLFKYLEKCHLITNAHCIANLNAVIKLYVSSEQEIPPENSYNSHELYNESGGISFFAGHKDNTPGHLKIKSRFESQFFATLPNKKVFQTNVKKISQAKDLAMIELPEMVKDHFCPQLHNIKFTSASQIASKKRGFFIAGFAKKFLDKPASHYVWYNQGTLYEIGECKYTPRIKMIKSKLIETDIPNFSGLIKINNIQLFDGMSGSALIDDQMNLLGITSQYIPSQDSVFSIPVKDVINFIYEENLIKNALTMSLSNSNIFGGDNLHADGGDKSISPRHPSLDFFQEPNEGISINKNSEILLAIGLNQIDGTDDFERLKKSKERRITRKLNGHPSLEIRKNIIKRLKGKYTSFYSKHKIFFQDEKHIWGWNSHKHGNLSTTIKVKKNSIKVTFGKHNISDSRQQIDYSPIPMALVNNEYFSKRNETYKISYSDDYKTVSLTSNRNNAKLTCNNKHYLKLICQGEKKHQFSISLSNHKWRKKDKIFKFRYLLKENIFDPIFGNNSPTIFHYLYGDSRP